MGDQPTSDRKRTPEEATAKAAEPRPDETVVLTRPVPDERGGSPTARAKAPDRPAAPRTDPGPGRKPGHGLKPGQGRPGTDETQVIRIPDDLRRPDGPARKAQPAPSSDDTALIELPAKPDPDPTAPLPQAPRTQASPSKAPQATAPPSKAPQAKSPQPAASQPQASAKPPAAPDDTVIIRLPGDLKPADKPARRKPVGDDTVIIKLPGSAPARKKPVGDDTVIIRLPGSPKKTPPPGVPGRKKPGADDTVIIRLPQGPKPKVAARAKVDRRSVGEDTVILRMPSEPKPAPKAAGAVDFGYAPWVLALSSFGVVVVALAYGGGRAESSWAMAAYWIGQIIVFSPVVFRLLSRLAGVAESFILVMGLAANQYMLKWMYSPDQFRFPDELQHWLATTLITESGDLFRPNQALPPAVHFPGLAEMGAAISQLTGLPVTAAGIIVAGVAHLIFVGLLFAAVLRASNSPAMAGVACVTYATAMHYLFFNSMFLYQTAALPFFMLAVWAQRRWRTSGGLKFLVLALVGIAMTTVSHHVTVFALAGTLLLLSVTELVLEKPRRWDTLIVPGFAVAVVVAWIAFVAPDVISYLGAPLERIAESLNQMFGGGNPEEASVTPPVPLAQLAVQGSGLLGLLILFLAVARDMLLRKDRDVWRWAALAGSAVFFAGNGARFLGSNGPEISSRLTTFTYIPMSIIAAVAIVYAVQLIPPKDENGRRWLSAPPPGVSITTGRRLAGQVYLGTALITVLMIGARTGGWPPVSALLPGPYLPAAFERSVDSSGVQAALWLEQTLGPDGSRVGGDITAVALSSTYGRQDPVREVGELFYATTWTAAEEDLVRRVALDYLVVDERLGDDLPANDAYFENDPFAGRITEPLTDVQLGKFDKVPAVSRLYDNGNVRIYQMGNS